VKTYVFDSYAMIAFFEAEAGADRVADILHELASKRAKGFISVINWGEIFYNTMREAGEAEAEKVMRQFESYTIQLVDADKELTYMAAKMKAAYRMAYADCFAAALSAKLGASLVTGDPDFKKLARQIAVEWIA
jgi:ribonuclease VapC